VTKYAVSDVFVRINDGIVVVIALSQEKKELN
jgi:hypothetical protein